MNIMATLKTKLDTIGCDGCHSVLKAPFCNTRNTEY